MAHGPPLWDFAGGNDRAAVNATYLQSFVSFTTPQATIFTLNVETTYDWQRERGNVPVNVLVSQLLKIGGQPVRGSILPAPRAR